MRHILVIIFTSLLCACDIHKSLTSLPKEALGRWILDKEKTLEKISEIQGGHKREDLSYVDIYANSECVVSLNSKDFIFKEFQGYSTTEEVLSVRLDHKFTTRSTVNNTELSGVSLNEIKNNQWTIISYRNYELNGEEVIEWDQATTAQVWKKIEE